MRSREACNSLVTQRRMQGRGNRGGEHGERSCVGVTHPAFAAAQTALQVADRAATIGQWPGVQRRRRFTVGGEDLAFMLDGDVWQP